MGSAVLMALTCVLGAAGSVHAEGAGPVDDLLDGAAEIVASKCPDELRQLVDQTWWTVAPSVDQATGSVAPLPEAHSHNDYAQARPLLDALDHGFTSVEVDVWLVAGELLVAHDRESVVPGWTLDRLYLSPLEDRQETSGGTVYPGWDGTFQLLIDAKSRARRTYAAVEDALAQHPGLVSTFTRQGIERRAVTVVISGHRDRADLLAPPAGHAGYEGRPSDLNRPVPAYPMPLVSADWPRTFSWDGTGPMPEAEEQKLRDIVGAAHDRGARVRFWGTPDDPGPARDAVWRELLGVGVDLISTDDLDGLQDFLSSAD